MTYTTIRQLGRGGFGVVELVRADDGSLYAKKTLSVPTHMEPAPLVARFHREVKYQSAIAHENVVRIIDHDLDADPPWFVMPFAQGSLQDEMSLDRSLGGDPRKALFDILSGLEEIHRRGYLHRDLKPANVLQITDEAGATRYALSDFGLMAVGEDGVSTLTPSGMGGGTPLYQAPECATNFKRATNRSDIYSFGALLYDIFSSNPRRLPHDELTLPGEVGPVIEKCTKRSGHRRYKNVEELRDALFAALTTFEFTFSSGEEEAVTKLLTSAQFPNAEEWDHILEFIDARENNLTSCANVFRALQREHILHINADHSDLLLPLGKHFADYCRKFSFDFDYCDILASKAQMFYDLGDIQLKSSIAVAMLQLGTNHNRWFVERKFLTMAGNDIERHLAERISVELDVLKIDFDREIAHVCRSISATPADLHEILRGKLSSDA
ncbi:serine/threonine-protein kinase [Methylobacterium sp. E-046]|uniref:serine/threonine-protein kinase n=1 Tax=Methylobacterium sp. E-046 TaxID=2836576 RepID=UPI001FB8774D|nr:serine/threonine-protein kinase [Methylobacterium sp. E-046]MCJ2101008.1 serine/threonine protein kinase [Methylobacterium sp. E-046]